MTLTADLDELYADLDRYPIELYPTDFGDERDDEIEGAARRLQQFVYGDADIDPQYSDVDTLTPEQLEPARIFRQWTADTLAAVDWADDAACRRAHAFWFRVTPHWAFSAWGLARVLRSPSPLIDVLARLLDHENVPLGAHAGPDGPRLGHLVQELLERTIREDREPAVLLVPKALRYEFSSNALLAPLARHPQAATEVPDMIDAALRGTPERTEWARSYLPGFLDAPETVRVLRPMLPRLRELMASWSPEQVGAFATILRVDLLADERLVINERLTLYSASPARRDLLAAVHDAATSDDLRDLTGRALSRVDALRAARAAQRPPAPAAVPGQIADFNLKLLVIRELVLMGENVPGTARVLKRPRDDEDYSYEPVESAVAAYAKVKLTPALLAKVTELRPDASDVWDLNIINNWDGEDDQFDIASLEGIELLPNLRVFSPISLVSVDDWSPLLRCPNLTEAVITDFEDADSDVCRALADRGVRITRHG